jgi:hypothetical protein
LICSWVSTRLLSTIAPQMPSSGYAYPFTLPEAALFKRVLPHLYAGGVSW